MDLAASKHDFVVLSWEIPRIEEPGKLHTVHGGHKGLDLSERLTHTHTHTHTNVVRHNFKSSECLTS